MLQKYLLLKYLDCIFKDLLFYKNTPINLYLAFYCALLNRHNYSAVGSDFSQKFALSLEEGATRRQYDYPLIRARFKVKSEYNGRAAHISDFDDAHELEVRVGDVDLVPLFDHFGEDAEHVHRAVRHLRALRHAHHLRRSRDTLVHSYLIFY